MLIWSILWAVLGLLVGLLINLGSFAGFYVTTEFPGGIMLATVAVGAIIGAVSGLVFGVLLMLAERNRRISDMRVSRVGLWAALASVAPAYFVFQNPIFVAVAGVLSFAGGALALRLAARGDGAEPAAREA